MSGLTGGLIASPAVPVCLDVNFAYPGFDDWKFWLVSFNGTLSLRGKAPDGTRYGFSSDNASPADRSRLLRQMSQAMRWTAVAHNERAKRNPEG